MSMLSARLLLLLVSASHAGTAILEDVVPADLEAVRIRLEEEKAKRLLLQNDVEVLMLQLEELKRKYDQKGNKAACVGTAILEDVGRTVLEADRTRLGKASRSLSQNEFDLLFLQARVLLLQAEELKRKSDHIEKIAGGTTYIRWGRTDCSGNGTELVYKGYMAGSEFTQTGSGTNHLCLPEYPTWAKYKDGNDDSEYRGHVYGAEYEMGVNGEYSPFSNPVLDNNAPCAVCRTIRSTSIMIPGRTNCYSGWTVEYSGYLVSSYYPQAAPSEYVCLDGDPEFIAGGESNQNGHVLYLVDVICGTLLCPPYVNGRELARVVCSK